MSFRGYGRAGLERANDKIAAEERYADELNQAREIRRAEGGGRVRHALRRIKARLQTEEPSDAQ